MNKKILLLPCLLLILAAMVSAAAPTLTIGIPNQPNTKYLEGSTQTLSILVGDGDSNASDFNISFWINTTASAGGTAIAEDINFMLLTGAPSDGNISGPDANTLTYSYTVPTLGTGVVDTLFYAHVQITDGTDTVDTYGNQRFTIYNPPTNAGIWGIFFGAENITDQISIVELSVYFFIFLMCLGAAGALYYKLR